MAMRPDPWVVLVRLLWLVQSSANAFPHLESVVGALIGCLDVVQQASGYRKGYDLPSELTSVAKNLEQLLPELASEDYSGSIVRIVKLIEVEVAEILRKQDHGQDRADVMERYHRIVSLFRQLENEIPLRIWGIDSPQSEVTLLQSLSPVYDVRYCSRNSTIIGRGCTPETREKILADLKIWADDPNGAKVYWMDGMKGTGKTTILYSLCKWLEENDQLGGDFCYFYYLHSHGYRYMNDTIPYPPAYRHTDNSLPNIVHKIIPTIAYRLAQFSPAFRSALRNILEKDPEAITEGVRLQFQKLIQQPMQELKSAMPNGVVVAIDSLDECCDDDEVLLFLQTLMKHAASLPIKFFITSRPNPVFQDEMLKPEYSCLRPFVLHLDDVERSIVEADIKKYLEDALSSMIPVPSPADIDQLVERAELLFFNAAKAVDYIHPPSCYVDSEARFQMVLSGDMGRNGLGSLPSAAGFGNPKQIHYVSLILWIAVCAKEPMSARILSSLLGLRTYEIWDSLRSLSLALHVPWNHNEAIFVPNTFLDYIFDESRSGDLYCDKTRVNDMLADKCINVIRKQLQFGICSFGSQFLPDKKVANLDDRGDDCDPNAITYACRYWSVHLREGRRQEGFDYGDCEEMNNFLAQQLGLRTRIEN